MPEPPLPDDATVRAAADLLTAIAHPARLRMLLALARDGSLTAGELESIAGLEQSATSHQLRVLRDARLVVAERDGRHVRYELHDAHVASIVADAVQHVKE